MKQNSSDMIKMGKPSNTCGCKHFVPVSFPLESIRLDTAGTNTSITMATAWKTGEFAHHFPVLFR